MFNEQQLRIEVNTESIQNEHTAQSFFDNNKSILEKGSIRHTITEDTDRDDPVTIITREYSAFDGTLNYREEITVASSVFKQRKTMLISEQDIIPRLNALREEIRIHSDAERYEICKEMKKEIISLEEELKIRAKNNG